MDDHIGHFLNFMSVEKGASGNTVAAYKNDLQQFDSYMTSINGNGKARDWDKTERDLIVEYLLTLRKKNYAEATVARKVAALKSFFQYLQAEGTIRGNPAESLESPRVGRSLPKPLSVTQVDELLEQPLKRNTPEAKRDRAMLELLYAAGLRVSELVSLNVEDLKTKKSKRYYSALLGEHQVDPAAMNRSFAPLSIAGHGTFTDTVRFYPVGNPLPKLADEAGDYRFALSLVTAAPARPDLVDRVLGEKPAPVVFERSLPWISEEQLGSRRITIPMPDKGWNAAPAAQK